MPRANQLERIFVRRLSKMPSDSSFLLPPSSFARRDFLLRGGAGFGAMALASLLGESPASAAPEGAAVLGQPHHKPSAKSVIFLFMEGGPSHIDLFDPKPELNKMAGQKIPPTFKP